MRRLEPPTGHVFRRDGTRRSTWYAKYRLPDGRQVQKRIGPAWTGRGRPPAGHFTKRTAEDWLRQVLDEARRGTLPGLVRTGATFADAAAEFLRYVEHDRAIKPSTLGDYRSIISAHLLPAFGDLRVEEITPQKIERWHAGVTSRDGSRLSNRTKNKLLVLLHGVFQRALKVYGLPRNPVAEIERHPQRSSGDIEVFSVEEVHALARAAASEQDAAIYLTAAFTGLRRGELVALRWRDVDFAGSAIRVRASYAGAALTTPKSGRVRSVPMAPHVAEVLARMGQRRHTTREDELVFPGETGGYLDGSALRRRYDKALKRAGLRPLRFHDLRHTFGTRMIARADIRRVQEWMGHADVQTTMRYLHYAPRHDEAALVADAFRRDHAGDTTSVSGALRGHRREARPTQALSERGESGGDERGRVGRRAVS
jgi:integrase